MKSLITKRLLLATAALCVLGFIIWPGCVSPPLPASRKPISSHKRADFSFGKTAHPSRSEVVAKVGEPDEYFADLRVACYKLNLINRRRLLLVFFVLPVAAPKDAEQVETAMIQFDENDRVQRMEIMNVSKYPNAFFYRAKGWIQKPAN